MALSGSILDKKGIAEERAFANLAPGSLSLPLAELTFPAVEAEPSTDVRISISAHPLDEGTLQGLALNWTTEAHSLRNWATSGSCTSLV